MYEVDTKFPCRVFIKLVFIKLLTLEREFTTVTPGFGLQPAGGAVSRSLPAPGLKSTMTDAKAVSED
jgi:hypothetical protein